MRRLQSVILLLVVAIAVQGIALLTMATSRADWWEIADHECKADAKSTNHCEIPIPCAKDAGPNDIACSDFHVPGTCSSPSGQTCWFQQNVICGIKKYCATGNPVLDGNGMTIMCTGMPDICSPVRS